MDNIKDLIDGLDLNNIPEDPIKDKKKRKNSCKKGKNRERSLCHELEELFPGDIFRRVPSSGAFMGGFNFNRNLQLNNAAKNTLTGDIITPSWFKFSIESKAYDDSPLFHKIVNGEEKTLDKWIEQATVDASKVDKKMLLMFRITTKRSSYVCIRLDDFMEFIEHRNARMPDTYIIYKKRYLILENDIFMKNYLSLYKSYNDWFYQL